MRVTVPVVEAPPVTVAGLMARIFIVGAVTVSVPVTDIALAVAVIVIVAADWTANEVTGNVAVDEPPGTVTVAGTVPTAVLLEESVTTNPPVGALPERVMVPVDAVAPTTDVGLNDTPVTTGAVIVRFALAVVLFAVAVMGTVTFDTTPTVVIVKVVDEVPAGTVTLVGTVADALPEPELKATARPPAGAFPVKVIVPVDDVPPGTDVGFKVKP